MGYYVTSDGNRFELDSLKITLVLNDRGLIELNLDGMKKLRTIWCQNNKLTKLDVQGLTELRILFCSDNLLMELNLDGLINLRALWCANNRLKELKCPTNIRTLLCFNNEIENLDLGVLDKLITLTCDDGLVDVDKYLKTRIDITLVLK